MWVQAKNLNNMFNLLIIASPLNSVTASGCPCCIGRNCRIRVQRFPKRFKLLCKTLRNPKPNAAAGLARTENSHSAIDRQDRMFFASRPKPPISSQMLSARCRA